jgi:bacterioferritin-associated ferredoxin
MHLSPMSDRVQLEKAEARILVPSYFKTVDLLGKIKANVWLTNQIGKVAQHYGVGFDSRCRKYMRQIMEEELCDMQQG